MTQEERFLLAGRLNDFARDFDPYDYADNMEVGMTEEDAVAEIAKELLDAPLTEGIREYLADAKEEMSEGDELFDIASSLLNEITEYQKSFAKPGITTMDMVSYMGKAKSMISPQDYSFKSDENQIDIRGTIIESGYEDFRPALMIHENGELLYSEDAACVDNYHNEVYTQGKFASEHDTAAYLYDKYKNVSDWQKVDTPVPQVRPLYEYPKVWSNPSYAKERESMANAESREAALDRIVFQDLGTRKSKDGHTYHAVNFAYACDKKEMGLDDSMPNPYLLSSRYKDSDGKQNVNHACYLSDSIYDNLMKYANTDGLDNSRWSGVIAAKVEYPTKRNGQTRATVNLTQNAIADGNVMKPSESFDEKHHDAFVKASLVELREFRKEAAATQLSSVAPQTDTEYDGLSV